MSAPNEITPSQLARLIGTPGAPLIVDVRIDEDFDDDPRILPTARRYHFSEVRDLMPWIAGQKVVVYCQKGKKISQGAAALLRCAGVVCETLEGGHFAWRDAGLPLIPKAKIRRSVAECSSKFPQTTRWVTRQRPKIDRIACPWLIRRFVDPGAEFLFVVPSEVTSVAEKFSAEPFDMEGVFWSHWEDRCTFDTMIEEFCLDIAPLKHLAKIVRAADTDCLELVPQASGQMAASLGLSRMYRNDLEQLDASMMLYDALYRWCRDATSETHDWPPA